MRKAEVHETPTLFALVHRAAEVCDPAEAEQTIAEEKGAIDPQDEDPVATMMAAVATYLAYRRDELDDDRANLLVLAARAGFDGRPPEPVASWLAEQGLEV